MKVTVELPDGEQVTVELSASSQRILRRLVRNALTDFRAEVRRNGGDLPPDVAAVLDALTPTAKIVTAPEPAIERTRRQERERARRSRARKRGEPVPRRPPGTSKIGTKLVSLRAVMPR